MIRYALICADCDHEFEAWFASSDAFDKQVERGLVTCAACDSASVAKQIMAPAVSGTKKKTLAEPDRDHAFKAFAKQAREHISDNFDYVGSDFASEARSMYYGETADRPIWGETTPEESEALKEEGVPAAPLPKAFAPAPPKPKDDLN